MTEANPIVRHLILCDDVQTDPDHPLRATLVGLLATIRSMEQPAYPLLYREFCVFVQLTSCRGPGDGRIQIEQSDTEQVIFRTRTRTLPLGNDPLELMAISFRIRNCLFPAAGLYWVQFWYNEQMLCATTAAAEVTAMSIDIRGVTNTRFVGEYVDEGEVPAGMAAGRTESAPTRLVASYVDAGSGDGALLEFTVLLNDGRTAAVRGHALKHLRAATGEGDAYGIIVRAADRDELIAVFKASEVSGIFHGELRANPTVA